jgi:mycothiol synthase
VSRAPTGARFAVPPWGREPIDGPAVRTLVRQAALADGAEALSGHVLQALDVAGAGDGVVGLLVRAGDLDPAVTDPDEPAGVVVARGVDPAEVVVGPAYRRRGIGTALVRAALDRQGSVWAYGNLPEAAALARQLGLARTRTLLQLRRVDSPTAAAPSASASVGSGASMRRPAADEAVLPDGVRIRTFHPGQDEEPFLAVNARAFAWHPEQGRLDLAGFRAETTQNWFDPAGFFLAVTGEPGAERVLGFHWTKVHPADPTPGSGPAGPVGEVYVLGVDPLSPIRGLGAPLTGAGLRYLAGRGLATVMLYVEAGNARAVNLYRRFGFSTYLSNVVYARPVESGETASG